MAMQMNVAGLRRNIKNIAHNYTDAQVKVREATSNDPWGPSSTVMAEIADLSYNVVAFSEIMQMIWKRLNDHGRNWRHVYKALVLLEYLIKTGSEKIADQCKENIFAIQTLKDFQYLEENKDMGMNVREKAKSLVSLLKDDERLRNERVRALKAKERFAQSLSAIGSDSDVHSPTNSGNMDTCVTSSLRQDSEAFGVSDRSLPSSDLDLENARPHTMGEEELQLQLALAMSKEEADQEEAKRKSDDVRLQIALNQSEVDFPEDNSQAPKSSNDKSALTDLLDINFNHNGLAASSSLSALNSGISGASVDPWGVPVVSGTLSSGALATLPPPVTKVNAAVQQKADPWGIDVGVHKDINTLKQADPWSSPASAPPSRVTSPPTANDPWSPAANVTSPEVAPIDDPWAPKPVVDPWAAVDSVRPKVPEVDPFSPIPSRPQVGDEFSVISSRESESLHKSSENVFNLGSMKNSLPAENGLSKSKSPTAFLGENSNLVNLDNLVSTNRSTPPGMGGTSSPSYQRMNYLQVKTKDVPEFNLSYGDLGSSIDKSYPPVAMFANSNNDANYTIINNVLNDNPTPIAANLTTPVNSNNPFLTQPTPMDPFVPGLNPFNNGPTPPNPFQAQQAPKPSLNEMRNNQQGMPLPSDQSPWGMASGNQNGGQFML